MVRLVYTGDRKLRLIKDSKRRLPKNFREVEYLESSGTQYIDTGWSPASNDLRVKFRTKSMSSPSATAVCGAEKNGITPRWVFILYGQNTDTTKTFPLTGDWNNNANGFTFTSGSVLEIDWTTSSTSTTITDKVSGTTYTKTFGSTINYPNNNITLKLFQNANNQKSSIQLNYYKIWDGGNLVRDFVPCLDNNNIPCMYDKVEGKAYYNAGTGTFSYGRKIIPVEYLESSGTQYINSGINADSSLGFKCDYKLVTTDPNQYMGAIRQDGSNYIRHHLTLNPQGDFGYNIADTRYDLVKDTNKHYLEYNAETHKLIQDTTSQNTLTSSFNVNLNYYIFGRNGNPSTLNASIAIRLYYFKMYKSGTLVRDYIPCKDENDVGFMFDKVTHTLYANAGTGSFVVGSEYKDITRFLEGE